MSKPSGSRLSLGKLLLIIYAVSLLFSNGPGVLLVNRSTLVAGFPLLYLWTVAFWLLQMSIIMVAYFRVWKDED